MQYLILGATGYIGSYLYQRLSEDGYEVIGTSRRFDNEGSFQFYDIQRSKIDSLLPLINDDEKIAIICIAESNIDKCCINIGYAYDVNVEKTKKLIFDLSAQGFQIIYFSSDNVFDGVSGNYTEKSCTNPINKYGLMKAQMEKYILQYEPNVCILRISKVVSTQKQRQNVFTDWQKHVEDGFIRCLKGNRMSFVYNEDVYQACLIVSEKKLHGLYNIVGDIAYSRAGLAKEFYNKMGLMDFDIREDDIDEFGFKDKRPLDTCMSNQKFKSETGYKFTKMDCVIEKFIS